MRSRFPLAAVALLAMVAACSPQAGDAARPDAAVKADAAAVKAAPVTRNTVQTLTLIGADGARIVLDRAAVAALPREKVSFSRHEDTSVFEGPLLLDVLKAAGVPASPLRKDQQATALLATAADGYQVVLGLGETDPATRADRIIVADTDDGQPLSAEDGPFMIVAEGDARAARSPRMVVSVQVIPLGRPRA